MESTVTCNLIYILSMLPYYVLYLNQDVLSFPEKSSEIKLHFECKTTVKNKNIGLKHSLISLLYLSQPVGIHLKIDKDNSISNICLVPFIHLFISEQYYIYVKIFKVLILWLQNVLCLSTLFKNFHLKRMRFSNTCDLSQLKGRKKREKLPRFFPAFACQQLHIRAPATPAERKKKWALALTLFWVSCISSKLLDY